MLHPKRDAHMTGCTDDHGNSCRISHAGIYRIILWDDINLDRCGLILAEIENFTLSA